MKKQEPLENDILLCTTLMDVKQIVKLWVIAVVLLVFLFVLLIIIEDVYCRMANYMGVGFNKTFCVIKKTGDCHSGLCLAPRLRTSLETYLSELSK